VNAPWHILVVDDEEDVHAVTRLALRRRRWLERDFALEHAYSAAEARALLERKARGHFQVALVDVVMETEHAGLELCQDIRRSQPPHVRLILRTGQPGVAPEEKVLQDYDVDHYLAKTEATRDRLFGLIRACLRSGRDIATLSAFSEQLRSFAKALQNLSSVRDLSIFMEEGLAFLESKHSAAIAFFPSLDASESVPLLTGRFRGSGFDGDAARLSIASRLGAEPAMGRFQLLDATKQDALVYPFSYVLELGADGEAELGQVGALYLELDTAFNENHALELMSDIQLFLENWRIAYRTLKLKERLARERLLREKMYLERVQSIANMVTSVSHEMSTPLGVANTASSMVRSLAGELAAGDLGEQDRAEIADDLRHSCELLEKNLERAHRLIASFKQLSASQLSDQRAICSLSHVIDDCVEVMGPALKKKLVTVAVHPLPEQAPSWDGFPGHLSQCILNFFTNTLRYGYPNGGGGTVDIRLRQVPTEGGADGFVVEFEDYGEGIAPELRPRIFEPFATSGRAIGGTGLGLAIVHNIVTNLLGGTIHVASQPGRGTRFTLTLPRRAPGPREGSAAPPVSSAESGRD
jgi:signal transduction histidine kinase/DNA-binding response OmpR family regulator